MTNNTDEMLKAFEKHFSKDNYIGSTRHNVWVGYVAGCTSYEAPLRQAMEVLERIADGGVKDKTTGYMSTMNRSDLRHEAGEALTAINKLLGEK